MEGPKELIKNGQQLHASMAGLRMRRALRPYTGSNALEVPLDGARSKLEDMIVEEAAAQAEMVAKRRDMGGADMEYANSVNGGTGSVGILGQEGSDMSGCGMTRDYNPLAAKLAQSQLDGKQLPPPDAALTELQSGGGWFVQ